MDALRVNECDRKLFLRGCIEYCDRVNVDRCLSHYYPQNSKLFEKYDESQNVEDVFADEIRCIIEGKICELIEREGETK